MQRLWAFLVIILSGVVGVDIIGQTAADSNSKGIRFEPTPARMERGKYLVDAVLHCLDCHSEIDDSGRPRRFNKPGAGRVMGKDVRGLIVAPNITADRETGAGDWTDEQIARALRQGIGHDGRTLHPRMPYRFYNAMTDEDLAAVIVYVRTFPAIRNVLPKTELLKQGAPVFPLSEPRGIVAPNPDDPIARGAYLANLAHCIRCHSPVDREEYQVPDMTWSGGQLFGPPTGLKASANLTTDPSGIPYYDEAVFIKTMRTGAVNNVRELSNIMPWGFFAGMTDDDLKAIWAYVSSVNKPRSHRVDNREAATLCPIDGMLHGLGDQNKPRPPSR